MQNEPHLTPSPDHAFEHSWLISSQLPVQYAIHKTDNIFSPDNTALLRVHPFPSSAPRRRFVVIDERINHLYEQNIHHYFEYHHIEHQFLILPTTEQSKSMDAVFQVINALNIFALSRRHEPIIGIGGGVLLDIVGFAASLYRRGIPYIRIPTTLIALVDAGIGVKTGVNFDKHKNRLGTYYPPLATLLDRAFLRSLDARHISNGLAEILKIALVADAMLFILLEQHGSALILSKFQDENVAPHVLYRAIHAMLAELEPNLWELDLNRKVDFGHTFSPALEMQAAPELLHGEAVAIDMAISTQLAYQRRLIDTRIRDRILNLIKKLRLPAIHPLCTTEFLYQALLDTILHRDGFQRLPLPIALGDAQFFNDITVEELSIAIDALQYPDRLVPS